MLAIRTTSTGRPRGGANGARMSGLLTVSRLVARASLERVMNFGMSSGQFQPQDRRMVDWQTGIRGLSVVLGVPSAPLPCLRHRRKFITRSRKIALCPDLKTRQVTRVLSDDRGRPQGQ